MLITPCKFIPKKVKMNLTFLGETQLGAVNMLRYSPIPFLSKNSCGVFWEEGRGKKEGLYAFPGLYPGLFTL